LVPLQDATQMQLISILLSVVGVSTNGVVLVEVVESLDDVWFKRIWLHLSLGSCGDQALLEHPALYLEDIVVESVEEIVGDDADRILAGVRTKNLAGSQGDRVVIDRIKDPCVQHPIIKVFLSPEE
jgi:hypothetical protein